MSHKESKVRFDKLIKVKIQFTKSQPHNNLIINLFNILNKGYLNMADYN